MKCVGQCHKHATMCLLLKVHTLKLNDIIAYCLL